MLQILKHRGWKYLLLGLVDVEANYTVVKAYQYTTLTSIQVNTPLTWFTLVQGIVSEISGVYCVAIKCSCLYRVCSVWASPAPGLLHHPHPDVAVLVGAEDPVPSGPLRGRVHLPAGGGRHGGGGPPGRTGPGIQ